MVAARASPSARSSWPLRAAVAVCACSSRPTRPPLVDAGAFLAGSTRTARPGPIPILERAMSRRPHGRDRTRVFAWYNVLLDGARGPAACSLRCRRRSRAIRGPARQAAMKAALVLSARSTRLGGALRAAVPAPRGAMPPLVAAARPPRREPGHHREISASFRGAFAAASSPGSSPTGSPDASGPSAATVAVLFAPGGCSRRPLPHRGARAREAHRALNHDGLHAHSPQSLLLFTIVAPQLSAWAAFFSSARDPERE